MNNINDKQFFLKNNQEKSQSTIQELNDKFEKRKLKPSEMLARFQWYRQNGLPTEINLQIEKFALEETGKNRGRIQQLILESDFPKLKRELDNVINIHKELEKLENLRPRYDSTNYTDFDDYFTSGIRLWEEMISSEKELLELQELQWEQIHKVNQKLWETVKEKGWKDFQPVWIKEYLARKQFYRQNGLPVELNMIIEEMVATDYTRSCQQTNHKKLVGYEKEKNKHLENISRFQEYIKNYEQEKEKYLTNIQEALNTEMSGIQELREKARQQKEIEEILANETKEYHAKWKQYLATKPLPELSQKQNKIKALGNKLKTEFKQIFKSKDYLKPINSNGSNFLTLLINTGLIFR